MLIPAWRWERRQPYPRGAVRGTLMNLSNIHRTICPKYDPKWIPRVPTPTPFKKPAYSLIIKFDCMYCSFPDADIGIFCSSYPFPIPWETKQDRIPLPPEQKCWIRLWNQVFSKKFAKSWISVRITPLFNLVYLYG